MGSVQTWGMFEACFIRREKNEAPRTPSLGLKGRELSAGRVLTVTQPHNPLGGQHPVCQIYSGEGKSWPVSALSLPERGSHLS